MKEIININLKIIFLENSELIKVVFFSKKFSERIFYQNSSSLKHNNSNMKSSISILLEIKLIIKTLHK